MPPGGVPHLQCAGTLERLLQQHQAWGDVAAAQRAERGGRGQWSNHERLNCLAAMSTSLRQHPTAPRRGLAGPSQCTPITWTAVAGPGSWLRHSPAQSSDTCQQK